MIQRIQSLYLFIVLAALTSMFFLPVAQIHIPTGENLDFFIYGISTNGEASKAIAANWTSISIICILIINTLLTILSYKNRIRQVRLSIANIFMMIGSVLLLWYNISNQAEVISAETIYKVPMIIPIVCIILTYLAIRAIGKDDALVKSMDRIR